MRLQGEWSLHPKYGEQFKFVEHETLFPATVSGMEKYLASGFIKGIGPVMAQRIVKHFGGETFEIIGSQIDRLAEVAGIGPKRLDIIRRAWEEQKQIREVMLFLQTHGISAAYAPKIFKQYGTQAVTVMQENPYQLATDIFGIGFLTADRMAAQLGFEKDNPVRLEAGLLYTLQNLSNDGHVFYPLGALLDEIPGNFGSGPGVDRPGFKPAGLSPGNYGGGTMGPGGRRRSTGRLSHRLLSGRN